MPSVAPWAAALLLASGLVAGCVRDNPVDTGDASPVRTAPVPTASPDGRQAPATPTTQPLLDPGAEPGWVVWVHDREPPDLHFDDPANGTDLAGWIQQGLLEGLFGVDSALAYYPELLASEPVVTRENDGDVRIDYTLRDGLTWSDGTPLTANDVAYTSRIIQDGCETEFDGSIVDASSDGCEYLIGSRIGYELITGFEVTSPTTFTIDFSAFFAGWRGLFPVVLAEHAFGADAFEVNEHLRRWSTGDAVLPSSGPLLFDEWIPGRHIDLARNEAYHGSVSPEAVNKGVVAVDGVRIVFDGDAANRAQLLSQGVAHLVMTPLGPEQADLTASGAVTVLSRPGGAFEHLGLNLLNPHLARPEVREALALAIDKRELIDQVYRPIVGDALPAEGTGNSYWMPTQAAYQDNQAAYAGSDPAAAAARLEAAGYTRAGDGWTHPESGPLRLRIVTTPGNELRRQVVALLAAQLGRAGIEVEVQDLAGGLFSDQGPFSPAALAASASSGRSGDPDLWDLAVWSWVTGPWPGGMSGIYRQESDSNPYGFSSPGFDGAAAGCEAVLDDTERAACYTTLDRYVTTLDNGPDGLFVIPLTQRPRYYAIVPGVLASAGVAPDLPSGGPLVNVGDLMFAS